MKKAKMPAENYQKGPYFNISLILFLRKCIKLHKKNENLCGKWHLPEAVCGGMMASGKERNFPGQKYEK